MRKWVLGSMLAVALAAGAMTGAPQTSKEPAVKGHTIFMEVLAGDQSKLPQVIQLLEEARKLDEKDVTNLYNLGRVYFFEALTFNKPQSATKAEQVFARIMELNPAMTEAMAFHGSLLTQAGARGDIAKFMQGVQEMKTAIAKDPNNINNHIVLPFTARSFPPQAIAAMGNYDPIADLEFVSNVFDGAEFSYAPHADVVMKAFVGEAYLSKGDREKAKTKFQAALAVEKPSDPGAIKGRQLLDSAITARLNGDATPLGGGVFSGCHSCHVTMPEKISR
jgi:hypothetical protein